MAISSSVDFAATRDDIITEALEQLGVLSEGESPNASQLTSCARTLNMMLKAWQGDSTNLFAIEKSYLFLQKDQVKYELRNDASADHWTLELINTDLTTAGVASDTTIYVTDGSSTANSDKIGIELDSGTVHWTTISSGGGTNTLVIASGLASAAAIGNRVYAYTTRNHRPMKILEAVRTDAETLTDVPLFIGSLRDYTTLSDKTSEGSVNTIYFDPQKTTSYLYVWPEPDRTDVFLTIWVKRTLHDVDAATDDVDFPQEWFMAIALNLALILTTKYGISPSEFRKIQYLAEYYKDLAENGDTEDGFTIEPESR